MEVLIIVENKEFNRKYNVDYNTPQKIDYAPLALEKTNINIPCPSDRANDCAPLVLLK